MLRLFFFWFLLTSWCILHVISDRFPKSSTQPHQGKRGNATEINEKYTKLRKKKNEKKLKNVMKWDHYHRTHTHAYTHTHTYPRDPGTAVVWGVPRGLGPGQAWASLARRAETWPLATTTRGCKKVTHTRTHVHAHTQIQVEKALWLVNDPAHPPH